MRGITAREVAQRLAAQPEAVVRELLPGGHREGNEWVAPSVDGNSRRALSIKIRGSCAGVWGQFDGTLILGKTTGDLLDLAAHVRFANDKKAAYAWALQYLGLATGGPQTRPQTPPPPPSVAADPHDGATRAAALRLFLSAQATLRNTPAFSYLKARGIDLAELGRQPRALRFHPSCKCIEAGAELPAMLAAISGPNGEHLATHRTFLAEQGGIWMKAPLRSPKKVLGSYAGGTIRLWRGGSGRPLSAAPELGTIVIAEGIETALSIAVACPEYRVLAAVSVSNLGRIILPASALDIVLAADSDPPGSPAAVALQRAVDRLLAEGRSVRIARSSRGHDFNDGLRE